MKSPKKDIDKFDYFLIICFNIISIIIGLFLKRNELLQDPWFIEAIADGLFGDSNRSILTLGSNFILTTIIYILSLTGFRLAWFHIILLAVLFISNLIFCKIIIENLQSPIKYACCIFVLIVSIYRLLAENIQYSAIAAYTISIGCLILFDYLDNNKSYKWGIFGIIWVLLGAAIRSDSIYFSIPLMGIVWIGKVIGQCKGKKSKEIRNIYIHYLTPFLIALILFYGIQTVQEILMNHIEKDYYEWNEIRSQIDDFTLPDYDKYKKEYQKIGISKNDYLLLKSWNNHDPQVFTDNVINEIIDLRNRVKSQEIEQGGIIDYIIEACYIFAKQSEFFILLIIMFIFIIILDKKLILLELSIVIIDMMLLIYFSYLGKKAGSSIHLTASIIVVSYVATYAAITGNQYDRYIYKWKNKPLILAVSIFMIAIFMFISPHKRVSSLWDVYYTRRISSDKFFSYLKLGDNTGYKSNTYNPEVSKYIENDKDNLYYRLIVFDQFSQQYPLTDRNFFITAPKGAAENWAVLGQYPIKLSVIRKNLENYGVKSPIPDLVNSNIRIEVKTNCVNRTALVLNNFLKEHYYDDVDFSIIKIIDNCVVGRYLRNCDFKRQSTKGRIQVKPRLVDTGIEEMTSISFKFTDINLSAESPVYLRIKNKEKGSFVYQAIMSDSKNGKVVLPRKSLSLKREYEITILFEKNGKKFESTMEAIKFKH